MRKASINIQTAAKAAKTPAAVAETPALRVLRDEDTPNSQDSEQPAAEQPTPAEIPAPVDVPAPAEQPAPVVELTPATTEEILEKVSRIKAVSERLTNHRHTSEELAAFQLGTSGFQDTLTLRDGTGKEWRTNRTPAIQLVLDMLRGELRTQTAATEAELRQLLAA